ncbi:hypothetical protein [Nostoc sp. DSM 114161]|uniref:hypothetical protein n=1 Tax=Nostoc sp. DSM 114161 TaxID=3440143 RepID=UPI0040458CFF
MIEVVYFFLDEFYLKTTDTNESQRQKRLTLIRLIRSIDTSSCKVFFDEAAIAVRDVVGVA